MKILLVNKFHYLKGGSEKYYFELGKLLKENGNEIAYFSMKDEKNISTGDKEYFVEPIDLNNGSKLKALDVIYSKNNYKKMINAIEDFKPDIVHLNNFQRQLSASVVKAAKDKKVPVVFTAHDVQAICPAITMLDSDHKICEDCIKGNYNCCFKKKCIKGSTLKSFLGSIEGFYYRKHKIYSKNIKHVITPSEFYRGKFINDGLEENHITAIHNFINIEDYNLNIENDNFALYSGRLSKEKGVLNLIEAFSNLVKENNDYKLYIAGDGPEKENIEKFIEEKKIDGNIKLLGYLSQSDLKDYTRKCKFLVVPSIWYENCPYSVLETQAIGKPIIGANIGGIPELVKNNENGLIYNTFDVNDLKEKMYKLFKDTELYEKFSRNAKEYAKSEYDKNIYYKRINKIYKKAIGE